MNNTSNDIKFLKKKHKTEIVESLPTIPTFMINFMINYQYTQTDKEKLELLIDFRRRLNGHIEYFNKPIKPKNPYIYFWKENNERIKAEVIDNGNNRNTSNISNIVAKECARQWKELDENKRQYYYNLHEEDKKKYNQILDNYYDNK